MSAFVNWSTLFRVVEWDEEYWLVELGLLVCRDERIFTSFWSLLMSVELTKDLFVVSLRDWSSR